MKKNDIVEIEITALSSECSGIGKNCLLYTSDAADE